MKLADLGEFGLIERFRQMIGEPSGDVIVGIGDDTAVYASRPGWYTLLTVDALVENVHFDLNTTSFESLGWKAVAVNLSDIAAMGGLPKMALISLAIPTSWTVEQIDSLFAGMKQCGDAFGCVIAGGDTTRSERDGFVSITVLGEVEEQYLTLRKGAGVGDLICVTGKLGGSKTGMEALDSNVEKKQYSESIERFLRPKPKIREARFLTSELGISSLIDISDGFSSELHHICQINQLGCLIQSEDIPVSEEVLRWSRERNEPVENYLFGSGEEYELLFTVDGERYHRWKKSRSSDESISFAVIGKTLPFQSGMRFMKKGKSYPIHFTGWNHFVI